MQSKSYAYPRYRKDVKSTSSLTRHINSCKISITLLSHHFSKAIAILEYNVTNSPDLLSKNNEEDISLRVSKNGEEEIRSANTTGNNDENIEPIDIDQQRPTIPNSTPQNKLLGELSRNFKEITFGKPNFLVNISVFDIRFIYPESLNNNVFYPFNAQLNYILAYYFADSETIKYNVNKFLFNPLMKPITKKLLYCNANQ